MWDMTHGDSPGSEQNKHVPQESEYTGQIRWRYFFCLVFKVEV